MPSAYPYLPIKRRNGIHWVDDKGLKEQTFTTDSERICPKSAGGATSCDFPQAYLCRKHSSSIYRGSLPLPLSSRLPYHFLSVIFLERRISAE
jgi:hypothetical protein